MTEKQLLNSILQRAIEGKLVAQDPSDEPASKLIERIREEKTRLIKEKKIRAPKQDSTIYRKDDGSFYERIGKTEICIDDELPFEIPDSWEWVRLNTIATSIIAGGDKPKDFVQIQTEKASIPVVANGKTNDGIIGYTGVSVIDNPSITVSARGTIGYTKSRTYPYVPIVRLICIIPSVFIDLRFLSYAIEALLEEGVGTSIPQLTIPMIKLKLLPVPPLAEQKRIIEQIEALRPLIKRYGEANTQLESLNAAFPRQLKQSLLQAAIQGQLVPQDPTDEPAQKLLDRIREEKQRLIKEKKIKAPKQESTIYRKADGSFYERIGKTEACIDDELPFTIPDSWEWVRLGQITNYGQCKSIPADKIREDDWILDLADIEKDTGKIVDYKSFLERKSLSNKHVFREGQLLYSKLRPYLNKVVIAPQDGYCTSEIIPVDIYGEISAQYIQLYMMSPYYLQYVNKLTFGVKMPRLSSKDVKNALCPLPSISEQKRIVETATDIKGGILEKL